ncbi:DUF1835 domain-containing protein [Paenibacillus silviterrae]|uniref:DUF1835 domain-containing protein n=1 Tax=Paenibacillus silviterrae TaxID=3242194 RepID=UPI002543AA5B|nr:DUF1835 domain-containing protein [Paenibacillus chinjuensis]
MLHIVNGDTVGERLRQGGAQGDILVWREVYPFGPIFEDMEEEGNRSVRAAFLEKGIGLPSSDYIAFCETQEQALKEFRKYNEIVLWFEHDLFDQTMLCYLLRWFARQSHGDTSLSLVCIGGYPGIADFRGLGQLTSEQLIALFGIRQAVGEPEFEAAKRFWSAYSSGRLDRHIAVLQEDTSALPFARAAFEAHLSRIPSDPSGLGSIERTTLELLEEGITSPHPLFHQAGGRLSLLGMGDLEYWYHLEQMSEGPYALVSIQGEAGFPSFLRAEPTFREQVISLTELGRKVLAGEVRWNAVKAREAWFGGIHWKSGCSPF